jgi:hypothetical protein
MRAALRLALTRGFAKLKEWASWLEREYPDPAGRLREAIKELFTGQPTRTLARLRRSLGSVHIIETKFNDAAQDRPGDPVT